MISHKLADDYVIADLFSFGYDLLHNFCSVCKNFLFTSFMMIMKYFFFFSLKKKNKNKNSA